MDWLPESDQYCTIKVNKILVVEKKSESSFKKTTNIQMKADTTFGDDSYLWPWDVKMEIVWYLYTTLHKNGGKEIILTLTLFCDSNFTNGVWIKMTLRL